MQGGGGKRRDTTPAPEGADDIRSRAPSLTELAPETVNAEFHWLCENIYHSHVLPRIPQRRVTARDRWRADPSDVSGPAPVTPTSPAPVAA